MARRFKALEYFFMQLAMRVLTVYGFKFFINSHFLAFQSNLIGQVTKIDQKWACLQASYSHHALLNAS